MIQSTGKTPALPVNPEQPPIPPLAGLLVGIGAVSTASVMIRVVQRQAPSLVIAAARLTLAALILAPIALLRFRPELRRLSRRDWLLLIASGIFLGLHFATWISSLEYTSVTSSVVLVTTSPLFVAIASRVFLHERVSPRTVMGLAVAVAGGVLIGWGDLGGASSRAILGDLLALAGAVAVAGYWIIGRRLRATLSVTPYVAMVYGVAALTLLLAAGVARQSFLGYRPEVYGWFLLLALVPQVLGHTAFNWALAHLPAAYVAVATLGEPVGSAILAGLLLREIPSAVTAGGAVLILAGILITVKQAPAASP